MMITLQAETDICFSQILAYILTLMQKNPKQQLGEKKITLDP